MGSQDPIEKNNKPESRLSLLLATLACIETETWTVEQYRNEFEAIHGRRLTTSSAQIHNRLGVRVGLIEVVEERRLGRRGRGEFVFRERRTKPRS